jgi:ribosomal protein L44E
MAQHYTRNTKAVSEWCPTCGRFTMHRVDDRRRGPCTEHQAPELSKKQEKARELQHLADEQPGFEF